MIRITDISSKHYTRTTRYLVVELCTLYAKGTKVWENSTGNSFWVAFSLSVLYLFVPIDASRAGSLSGTC